MVRRRRGCQVHCGQRDDGGLARIKADLVSLDARPCASAEAAKRDVLEVGDGVWEGRDGELKVVSQFLRP